MEALDISTQKYRISNWIIKTRSTDKSKNILTIWDDFKYRLKK